MQADADGPAARGAVEVSSAEVFCRAVDWLNERVGKIACWLIIPLTFIIGYDVGMRYLFGQPTAWAWDIGVQLAGLLVIFGGGYTLLHGGHIGVDVLVEKMSPRRRAFIDVATGVILLYAIGILVWKTGTDAWNSLQIREEYNSYFSPPIYPFKVMIVIGGFLLLLQAVVKLIRDIITATSGRVPEGAKEVES